MFGDVRFCPTGGITQDNAADWLGLPSVACVGGSWLVPAGEPVDAKAIRRRARPPPPSPAPENAPVVEQPVAYDTGFH